MASSRLPIFFYVKQGKPLFCQDLDCTAYINPCVEHSGPYFDQFTVHFGKGSWNLEDLYCTLAQQICFTPANLEIFVYKWFFWEESCNLTWQRKRTCYIVLFCLAFMSLSTRIHMILLTCNICQQTAPHTADRMTRYVICFHDYRSYKHVLLPLSNEPVLPFLL
jgi:hypothetical protein